MGSGLKTNVGNTGGTVSTIAFTPVQGLELVDPKVRDEMNRKRKAEEDPAEEEPIAVETDDSFEEDDSEGSANELSLDYTACDLEWEYCGKCYSS